MTQLSKNKKIMVFGTFDILHKGHSSFLKQARAEGDYLLVVLARDKTVKEVKDIGPLNNEQRRFRVLEESDLVDEVVLGGVSDKYEIIAEHKPDVICLGYDQKFFIDNLGKKLEEFGLTSIEIIRLKSFRPEIFKSSKLRKI